MSIEFIGRSSEKAILEKALLSKEAELISVIGRRRVGKTFLVRSIYKGEIVFEISGIQDVEREEQLRNFNNQLKTFFPQSILPKPPSDWLDAFFILIELLNPKLKGNKKIVVFFDEVPWLCTHKSGFIKGFSYFWNSWAVKQNIVVVLCGSAASWMMQKILNNKGGLHNRVSQRIRLYPFTLSETENYLKSRNISINRYQILQIYMAIGGIPHYLKEVEKGKSAVQNINQICFSKDGLLRNEFNQLYPALFDYADYHIAIIRALATKHSGMSRNEIVSASKLPEGGRISKILEELTESGFITTYAPYGKQKKDTLFRLTDEYSLFYLRFIEKNKQINEDTWIALSQKPAYKIWSGYAFESICLKHIDLIKKALGITGVYSINSSFLKIGSAHESGAQIDMLIDRNDFIINLIETKFYNTEFTINKSYAATLREKIRVFQETTKTKKQLFITLISTFGLKHNQHSLGLVTSDLTLDDLFEN